MKILIICYDDPLGPGTKHAYNFAKNLSKKHKVILMVPKKTNEFDFKDSLLQKKKNLKIIYIKPIFNLKHYYSYIIPEIFACLKEDFDIIHAWTLQVPFIVGITIKLLKKKPTVVHIEDSESGLLKILNKRTAKSLVHILYKIFLKWSDGSSVISPEIEKELIKSKYKKPKQIVYGGVDYNFFSPKNRLNNINKFSFLKGKGTLLGFAGSIKKTQDIDLIIKSLPLLPYARLVVIGDGPYTKELVSLSNKLKVSERVNFLGYVDINLVPKLLNCCDILMLPLRKNEFNKKRWPAKLTEYLALGKPVVTNPVGATLLFKNYKNIFFVKKETPAFYADKIKNITKNKKRIEFDTDLKKLREKFSWHACTKKLEKLYIEVLNNKK